MSLISVLIPVYNEEESLPLFYPRLRAFAGQSEDTYEFIFIDDGSRDRSFAVLRELSSQDSRVKVIKLSRNFGSHAACLAGLVAARGEACVSMPADLQVPPELVRDMAQKWKEGHDVVFAVKEEEGEGPRFFQNIYYSLVRRLALHNMPRAGVDLFLMDRKVVDVIAGIREKNTSLLGLILWSGFTQTSVTYRKGLRHRGVSKWTFGRKIKLFIDTFVSFSYVPIRTISVVGILFSLLGFSYAVFIVANRILYAAPIEGWSSLMVVLLVVSGVQMMMLGILGEYLWRNIDETRKRPAFIVDQRVGFDGAERLG